MNKQQSLLLLDAYREHLVAIKGVAHNTVETYDIVLTAFVETYEDLTAVTQSDVENYMVFLTEKGLKANTQSHYLSTLKTFYSFLMSKKVVKENPCAFVDMPKVQKRLPKAISENDMMRILEACKGEEAHDIRMRAMFYLLYSSGIRASELASLTLNNVRDMDEGFITVTGKGGKTRLIPIAETAKNHVKYYIDHARWEFNKTGSDMLFPSPRILKKGLTRQRIFQLLKEIADPLGIEISPHGVRHSFATHLLENEANLRAVQLMLGHENLSTTEVYTKIENKQKQKVVENNHPLCLDDFGL